jgi:hypothetical protein
MTELVQKLFGKIECALEQFTLKCQAEARRIVVDLKVLEDPEVARLSKETMLLRLRQERANLQRQAALTARPTPGPKQGNWRDGKSRPHQGKPVPKDKQPLTHRMQMPVQQPEVEAAPAAPEVTSS